MRSDGPCMDGYPFVLSLAALGLDLLLLKTLQPFCWSLSSNHLTPPFQFASYLAGDSTFNTYEQIPDFSFSYDFLIVMQRKSVSKLFSCTADCTCYAQDEGGIPVLGRLKMI